MLQIRDHRMSNYTPGASRSLHGDQRFLRIGGSGRTSLSRRGGIAHWSLLPREGLKPTRHLEFRPGDQGRRVVQFSVEPLSSAHTRGNWEGNVRSPLVRAPRRAEPETRYQPLPSVPTTATSAATAGAMAVIRAVRGNRFGKDRPPISLNIPGDPHSTVRPVSLCATNRPNLTRAAMAWISACAVDASTQVAR